MQKRIIDQLVALLLFVVLVSPAYAQQLTIKSIQKIKLDDETYSLKIQVELKNNTKEEIVIPNVIKQQGDFIAVSNISSSFFTLRSTDDIFPEWETIKPPQDASYPKLKRQDIIQVKPKSTATFEMNTSYFDYNGYIMNSDKKSSIQLVYQPNLVELDKNRKLFLDPDILDIKFYEKEIVSKPAKL
jgi:hypothetical protein